MGNRSRHNRNNRNNNHNSSNTNPSNTNRINNNSGTNTPEYVSAQLMLGVIQSEYNYETDRSKSLESRTGVFIAFNGALMAFMPTIVRIPSIKTIKVNNVIDAIPYTLFILVIILTFASLMASIVYFIRVIFVKEYKRLSISGFNETNALYTNDKVAMSIIKEYGQVISFNKTVNNGKVELFKKGIYCILVALLFMITAYIFSLVLS